MIIRAEPHLTEGDGVDKKDWVSVNARTSEFPSAMSTRSRRHHVGADLYSANLRRAWSDPRPDYDILYLGTHTRTEPSRLALPLPFQIFPNHYILIVQRPGPRSGPVNMGFDAG